MASREVINFYADYISFLESNVRSPSFSKKDADRIAKNSNNPEQSVERQKSSGIRAKMSGFVGNRKMKGSAAAQQRKYKQSHSHVGDTDETGSSDELVAHHPDSEGKMIDSRKTNHADLSKTHDHHSVSAGSHIFVSRSA